MDEDGDLIFPEPHLSGNPFIKDLGHISHFNKMVPGTNRSQLVSPPLHGPVGNLFRIGAFETPLLLDVLEVTLRAVASLDGPSGPLSKNLALLLAIRASGLSDGNPLLKGC